MSKEEKAIEYAKMRYGCNNGNRETGNEIAKVIACRVGFEAGWDGALKSVWIKVEDELPKVGVKVLVLTYNGKILVTFRYIPKDIYGKILGEAEWNGSKDLGNSIIAWMPIPSFDKILEDNKDVFKRLKDKHV